MKISKSKRVFSLLIATTFALFGLLVLSSFAVHSGGAESGGSDSQSVTDLTGYTWVANDILYGPYVGAQLNFVSDNIDFQGFNYSGTFQIFPTDYPSSPSVMAWTYNGGWSKIAYKTFAISGGADSSNSDVISWLVANGSLSLATPTPTPTASPSSTPSPTPDPAEWLNNYIFNQTSEDMWVGVEDINSYDVTYDVIPAWSYKNFYFKRNTTYRIIARTEQDNDYYSLQYYTDLYNYVPLEYSLSSEGWYTYTELPYTSINISTGSDTNTSGIYTFVRFRHDLPTLPPVTPVPGSSFTPDPSSSPTEVPYITPIPGNPTLIPDNSTPTPIPDISGEAVAGFNKLTNIFNGIFDAAYQSVNAANGNFWTSFFFIGLPIFLVILGLIAWIIFGSSDDD